MARALSNITVTKANIVSTSGANRRPGSGDAIFSDGRRYEFLRLPEGMNEGAFALFSHARLPGGGYAMRSFRSPARVAALVAYLGA